MTWIVQPNRAKVSTFFSIEGQIANILGLWVIRPLSQLFNSVTVWNQLQRQYITECVWLCSSKILFTKKGSELNLTWSCHRLMTLEINDWKPKDSSVLPLPVFLFKVVSWMTSDLCSVIIVTVVVVWNDNFSFMLATRSHLTLHAPK